MVPIAESVCCRWLALPYAPAMPTHAPRSQALVGQSKPCGAGVADSARQSSVGGRAMTANFPVEVCHTHPDSRHRLIAALANATSSKSVFIEQAVDQGDALGRGGCQGCMSQACGRGAAAHEGVEGVPNMNPSATGPDSRFSQPFPHGSGRLSERRAGIHRDHPHGARALSFPLFPGASGLRSSSFSRSTTGIKWRLGLGSLLPEPVLQGPDGIPKAWML